MTRQTRLTPGPWLDERDGLGCLLAMLGCLLCAAAVYWIAAHLARG